MLFRSGSPVTGFKYSINGIDYLNLSLTDNLYIIDNLTNGQSYSVQLKAVNAIGDGEASGIVSATPRSAPSAPTITSVLNSSTYSLVSFSVTDSGGFPITGYKYSLDGGNYISTTLTDGKILVGGLVNNVSRMIRVLLVNSIGACAPSEPAELLPGTTGIWNAPIAAQVAKIGRAHV